MTVDAVDDDVGKKDHDFFKGYQVVIVSGRSITVQVRVHSRGAAPDLW